MASIAGEYERRFRVAAYTWKWAVTMTKVRIRQAVAKDPWPRLPFVTFCGSSGRESRGVVDMIVICKDHGTPYSGTKRGDALKLVLVQIKGGVAAKPTDEDSKRLRVVAQRHGACGVLLATWKKGKAAQFFSLSSSGQWSEAQDLREVFR